MKSLRVFRIIASLPLFALSVAFLPVVVSGYDNGDYLSPSTMYRQAVLKSRSYREHQAAVNASIYIRRKLLKSDISLQTIKTTLDMKLATKASDVSEKCLADSLAIWESPEQSKLLRFLDALGKAPSGILNGNLKWIGDFDECIGIELPNRYTFKSQYCRVSLSFNPNPGDYDADSTVWGFYPGVNYGICLPDSCTEADLPGLLNPIFSLFGLTVRPSITHCHIPHPEKTDLFYIALTVFCVFGFLMALGLLVDAHCRIATKNIDRSSTRGTIASFMLMFSPLSNVEKLMTFPPKPNPVLLKNRPDLSAINGIRALSLFWVVLGHVYAIFTLIADNTFVLGDLVKYPSNMFIMTGYFAVDTFFFLSGFLAYYSIEKIVNAVQKNKTKHFLKSLPMIYIHRYLRLTPAVAATMLIDLGFWAYFYNGPFYLQETDKTCLKGWWTNLLYINNFMPPEYQCIAWVWYLAVDTQLFVLVPFVVYLLASSNGQRDKPAVWGWAALCLGFLIQFVSSITLTIVYNLPIQGTEMNGMNPDKNYADFFATHYIATYTRMGPYVVGILFGHLAIGHFSSLKRGLFSRRYLWAQALGWILSMGTILTITYGLYDYYNGKVWFPLEVEALYNATATTAWGFAIGWIILACVMNRAGVIGWILSWPGWSLPARLSYSAYMLHSLVMLFWVHTSRRLYNVTDMNIIFSFLSGIFGTLLLSIPFSLAFESPFINLLHRSKAGSTKQSTPTKDEKK